VLPFLFALSFAGDSIVLISQPITFASRFFLLLSITILSFAEDFIVLIFKPISFAVRFSLLLLLITDEFCSLYLSIHFVVPREFFVLRRYLPTPFPHFFVDPQFFVCHRYINGMIPYPTETGLLPHPTKA
jgi:hypothetical protein